MNFVVFFSGFLIRPAGLALFLFSLSYSVIRLSAVEVGLVDPLIVSR